MKSSNSGVQALVPSLELSTTVATATHCVTTPTTNSSGKRTAAELLVLVAIAHFCTATVVDGVPNHTISSVSDITTPVTQ